MKPNVSSPEKLIRHEILLDFLFLPICCGTGGIFRLHSKKYYLQRGNYVILEHAIEDVNCLAS